MKRIIKESIAALASKFNYFPMKVRVNTLEALMYVQRSDFNRYPENGICAIMRCNLYPDDYVQAERLMRVLFKAWPHYSGNDTFPVLAPAQEDGSRECPIRAFFSTASKWEGEYGEMRKDLLNFMITKLREWINET